ncbi:Odorant receptor 7a [Culex quinquefasciatus]|uniref:Odorant receptor 7a n=1 Tax=Culex quinquefasciatus TaxID=7176 RepID=B0WGC3_CULQU|nr:Odorant receptor 7a [Culex quinquefasciatus]|eukprot:XP_001847757.1 Odorant receptor 7a [Culex quinquefasciatus]
MVSLLNEAYSSIGRALYNLKWPTKLEYNEGYKFEYRSVRQTMITVLVVSQQSLGLNCFGFFEFTQERFWELLSFLGGRRY